MQVYTDLFDWVLTSSYGFLLVPRVSGIMLMVSLVEILLLDSCSGISTNSWTCIDAVCWDVKIRQQVNSSYMYSQFSCMFSLTSTFNHWQFFLRKMLTCVHIISQLYWWSGATFTLTLPFSTTSMNLKSVNYWATSCSKSNLLTVPF